MCLSLGTNPVPKVECGAITYVKKKKKESFRNKMFVKEHIVPHSTDTQSLARDTPYCARSTLDIVVQARGLSLRTRS